MVAANQRDVIAKHDVGRRRDERTSGTGETGKAGHGGVRYRVLVPAAIGKQLVESKVVRFTLPKISRRRNMLRNNRDIRLGFVNEGWRDQPGVRQLVRSTGSQTIAWAGGQLRRNEGAVGIDQVVIVMNITAINAMRGIYSIVNPQYVLTIV